FQLLGHKWLCWLSAVLQSFLVQALAFTRQLNPRSDREEVSLHTVFLIQNLLRTQGLVDTDTGGQNVGFQVAIADSVELVDAAVQTFDIQVLWLCWLVYRLVVHSEVVHDTLAIFTVHTVNTTCNQVCNLVAEGWVVLQNRRVGRRQDRGVPIHVLQALTGQGGAAGGCTNDEATCHLVSSCPECVAGALETKHREEDVQRNNWLTGGGIGGCGRGDGGNSSGFGNASVHDLATGCFA